MFVDKDKQSINKYKFILHKFGLYYRNLLLHFYRPLDVRLLLQVLN